MTEQRASCGCSFDADFTMIAMCRESAKAWSRRDLSYEQHIARAAVEIATRAARPSATMGAMSEEDILIAAVPASEVYPLDATADSYREGFRDGVRWREQHGGAAVDWRGLMSELLTGCEDLCTRIDAALDTLASPASAEVGEDGKDRDIGVDQVRGVLDGDVRGDSDGGGHHSASLTDPPAPLDREAAWKNFVRDAQGRGFHWAFSRPRLGPVRYGFDAAWALLAGRPAEAMVLRSETCACTLDWLTGFTPCGEAMRLAANPVMEPSLYSDHVIAALGLFPVWPKTTDPAPDSLAVEAEL